MKEAGLQKKHINFVVQDGKIGKVFKTTVEVKKVIQGTLSPKLFSIYYYGHLQRFFINLHEFS